MLFSSFIVISFCYSSLHLGRATTCSVGDQCRSNDNYNMLQRRVGVDGVENLNAYSTYAGNEGKPRRYTTTTTTPCVGSVEFCTVQNCFNDETARLKRQAGERFLLEYAAAGAKCAGGMIAAIPVYGAAGAAAEFVADVAVSAGDLAFELAT
mmetsp:Transcript_136183/g.248281  ORF Transcript_136183/g.248281 Transcript_136183/m.248281 type:complete len:152 (+) Transcript_136183:77-532(+)